MVATKIQMRKIPFLYSCLLIVLSIAIAQNCNAQTGILSRIISVSVTNERLDKTLEKVATAGHFQFSYNTGIIKIDSTVSVTVTDKPVKEVLDNLLGKKITYVENGNYLILKKSNPAPETIVTKPHKTSYIISGYVVNKATGEKVNEASVYDKISLSSSLSGPNGFFTLKLKTNNKSAIGVSKDDFLDTVIIVKPADDQQVTISISPTPKRIQPIAVLPDTNHHAKDTVIKVSADEIVVDTTKQIEHAGIFNWLLSVKQKIVAQNLHFTEHRPFQLSLVPGVSTNLKLGSHIVNDVSINIFGGFTGGTDVLEMGAFFNIDRGDVKYVQMAGFVNGVGGNVRGFQGAGFVNFTLDSVNGVQGAGFVNFAGKGVNGSQLAGFVNYTKNIKGFQGAGFVNVALDTAKGVQGAGFVNFAKDKVDGAQLSGFVNYTHNISGLQATGFVNVASGTMSGAQLAGFVNYATKAHGLQIGVINIADSSTAIPIGVFSYVVHGFHKLEISTNEVTGANISFKSGITQLYNILMAGITTGPGKPFYSLGYGLGHEFVFSQKFGLDMELTNQFLFKYYNWQGYNGLYSFNLNFVYQPFKKVGVVFGPSLNVYFRDDTYLTTPNNAITSVIPVVNVPSLNFIDDTHFKEWIGFHVGLRVF